MCHTAEGLAKNSRLLLKPGTDSATVAENFEMVKEVAAETVDGTSVLLLRPSGRHPEGHTGGTLIEFNSPDYQKFATFVGRVIKGKGCEQTVVTCTEDTPGNRVLRRLTRSEFDATIHDLFPSQIAAGTSYGNKFAADAFVHGFDNNAAALTVSGLLADQVREAAEEIAGKVMASPGTTLPCAPAKGDEACATQFIDEFGKKAFRRPLSADDKARYLTLYKTYAAEGFSESIKWVIAAMLQSPHFLYRAELGADGAVAGTVKLTPHEVATELSYFLWGTMPDAELMAAADSGALASQDEIEKQATRLLADEKSDPVITRFVEQWLDLNQLDTIAKDAVTYPEFDAKTRAAMRNETLSFVKHVVRQGTGTLDELLTAKYSFMDASLATFYGLPAPGADGMVDVSGQGAPASSRRAA